MKIHAALIDETSKLKKVTLKSNSQILALNLALTRMTGARARAKLRARVQTIPKI